MTSLCDGWWCSNMICMSYTLPKVKKSSSWKIYPLSQKKKLFMSTSRGITRNKYMIVLRSVFESSKSIVIVYTIIFLHDCTSASLECNKQTYNKQFLWESWTPFLCLFSRQGRIGKLKNKKHVLCCRRFHSLLVAFKDTKTCTEGESKQTKSTVKLQQDFPEFQHKPSSLTSLAFMPLIPGANRVIRQICIWFIYLT